MRPLELRVLKTKGIEFYPKSLERGSRSVRALKIEVAEMYLRAVLTRKVERILEKLCGMEISSTQVARVTQLLDEELEAFRNGPLYRKSATSSWVVLHIPRSE